MNTSKMLTNIRRGLNKHKSEIFIGLGAGNLLLSTYLAVKDTPKAIKLIEAAKKEKDVELLSAIETVKAAWKSYIPATGAAILGLCCLVAASRNSSRQNAALAAAYSLSETALKEYQDKVISTIGKNEERKIRDEIAKDKIEKHPVKSTEVIVTSNGDTLCYDSISGRYFKSDIEKIRRSVNSINKAMMDDMYVSLNDFYEDIGLPCTKIGDDLGWNIEDGLMDVTFSSQLSPDGTPCLVIDFFVAPRYYYYG